MTDDKLRIIFVDDEQAILDELRQMLSEYRDEWRMTFTANADTALSLLDVQGANIVITDMRMPGMSGQELLTHVRDRHPGIIRIALTGSDDHDILAGGNRSTHQCIQKPCSAARLASAIFRAQRLLTVLEDEKLRTEISRIECLPSPPPVHQKLLSTLHDPNVTTTEIAELIASDPALTVNILHLVNSSLLGVQRHIDSIDMAVNLLGLKTVQTLTVAITLVGNICEEISAGLRDSFWSHCAAVASLSQEIATCETRDKTFLNQTFLAGLLHDIGKLLLAANFSDRFIEAAQMARDQDIPMELAELHVFGTTHSEVGGYLLGLWGFPEEIVDTAIHHHHPESSGRNTFTPLAAVHVANEIVRNSVEPLIDTDFLDRIGKAGRCQDWLRLSACAA